MRRTLAAVLGMALLASACQPASDTAAKTDEAETQPVTSTLVTDAASIKAHITYLASDELEGREAGTAGYDTAAEFVASEMEKLGVTPAGNDGTYFQTVPLQRSYRVPDALELSVTEAGSGAALPLEPNVDYVMFGSTSNAASSVEAEAVFVGYGIVAPDLGRDDYAGLDVEGKIVVTLRGTPKGIQTEERAFYGSQKSKEASDRGAIGVVSLTTPTRETVYSFARLVGEGRLESARMSWLTPDGETFSRASNLKANGLLSMEGGRKLIEGAGQDFDALMEAAETEGATIEGFTLPYRIAMSQASTLDTVESNNVLGMIEGSDPVLKNEVIALTAHLDHIGLSKTFEDDKINNGALDNAAGVSTLLEAARLIMAGERPKRSIMLVIVTAEEKGLLGAQYFAQNPTVDVDRLVGSVNLDMPVLTYDFEDVVAFGSDRSTIEGAVRQASDEMGMTLSPDPMPDQGLFTRSDHFRFVQIGVPSVFLATGYANGGEEAWAAHFANNYHRPSDEMNDNINIGAAAKFAELNTRIALILANRDERPLWNKDDFFARQFDGPQVAE